jgi:capsular exopolysaccharide synthesis family protein
MVSGDDTSNILEVLARGSSPERARDLADAFAREYLANRKAYDQGRLQDAVNVLQGKLDTLSDTIDRLTAAGAGSSSAGAAQRAALASATAQYTDLLRQQQDLQVEIALKHGGAEIVSPAELPTDPSSPKRLRDVVIGLFVGLVLGVVLGLIREQMNSRVSSAEEAEQLTALPLLGEIPVDAASRSRETHLFMRDQTTSAAAESMRSLRTAIQLRDTRFREVPASVAWIVVTSPGPTEGKSLVAANLAASFAEAGQRTLLVSADLRSPRVERFFKLPEPNVGLGDYIKGKIPLDAAVASTDVSGLWVLRAGTPVENPAGVFISERFDDLLAGITEGGRVEVVVFDTPPVLAVADASELAVRADEVLLVVAEDETSRRAAQRSRAVLDGVGGDAALGLVVNKVPVSSSLFDSYFRPVPH